MRYIQIGGMFRLFIFAVVAAIVVFLVGIIAAQVLREVGQPSSHTLSWAVVLALIAAALWTWGPQFVPQSLAPGAAEYAVLAGAIIGYIDQALSGWLSAATAEIQRRGSDPAPLPFRLS